MSAPVAQIHAEFERMGFSRHRHCFGTMSLTLIESAELLVAFVKRKVAQMSHRRMIRLKIISLVAGGGAIIECLHRLGVF